MQSPESEAKFVAEVDAVVGDRRPSEPLPPAARCCCCMPGSSMPGRMLRAGDRWLHQGWIPLLP